jgi:hypothetical protein
MIAIHDQFSDQLRTDLKTTSMGLGFVKLLQDAGRGWEARKTLYLLEIYFQTRADELAEIIPMPSKTTRESQSPRWETLSKALGMNRKSRSKVITQRAG